MKKFQYSFFSLFINFLLIFTSGCYSNNNLIYPKTTPIPTKTKPQNQIHFNKTLSSTKTGPIPNTFKTATSIPNSLIAEDNSQWTDKEFLISSPLQGLEIDELEDINSNPFLFLGPGKDEGHHGTDFSFYQYKNLSKIEELPVQSIFSGVVSAVVDNSPPYGNMIIIETSISDLPEPFLLPFISEISFNELPYPTNLNCPEYSDIDFKDNLNDLSLYVLYAHLYEPSGLEMSKQIQSGDQIGKVGNTGASGNPHLHLEFRVGPSGIQFDEMAHYDNGATTKEMMNYCVWRVSGYFYQVDPMQIIQTYLQNR